MDPEGIFSSPQPKPDPLDIIRQTTEALAAEREKINAIGSGGYYELDGSEKQLAEYIGELMLLHMEGSETPPIDKPTAPFVERPIARQKYRELNEWNREGHDQLVKILEPLYLDVSSRIKSYVIEHQEQLQQKAMQVMLTRIPYSIASLPPNLFDHWGNGRPFIPQTNAETARLVGEYCVHTNRLKLIRLMNIREFFYGLPEGGLAFILAQGLDIAEELHRRRDQGDRTFETEAGQREWKRYNEEFKRRSLRFTNYTSLIRNAVFTSYGNNIRFSQEGGFFDSTDGKFDSFLLADFIEDYTFGSAENYARMTISQIRAPIGHYELSSAKSLARGTYVMMKLMADDRQFAQDRERLVKSPEVRTFLKEHLMRVGTRPEDSEGKLLHRANQGILDTGLEGILSVSGLSSAIEADGIPGYEGDLWGGVSAALDADAHVKLTSIIPEGIIGPMTIHGDRFRDLMIHKQGALVVRPGVAAAWQEVQNRRTAQRHAAWSEYYKSDRSGQPPIRFGLHCPFKGPVVRAFAETLMVCRAVAA